MRAGRRWVRQRPRLRSVPGRANVRRGRHAVPVRRASAGRRVHPAHVHPARAGLRTRGRWLRRDARLRHLPRRPVVRRRRRRGSLRRSPAGRLHAADLPAATHQLRSGRRRVRAGHRLRDVPDRAGLRCRGRAWTVRLARRGRVRAADVPAREDCVRSGGRRLRQRDRLRFVHAAADLRRGRSAGPVRRQFRLSTADVPATEHRMRAGRRRMWRTSPVRHLRRSGNVRRRRRSRTVRWHRVVCAEDVPEPAHCVRPGRRRVRWFAPMRYVRLTADMRRRRRSGPVRRRHDVTPDTC
jgi:hypothetical protein